MEKSIQKVGYFSTSQQVTYGKNKSGKTIYQVIALNNKNNESSFYLVAYGNKIKGKLLIVFNIINEKNDSQSNALPLHTLLPRGEIIDIIGHMNKDNLIITLKYIYNVFCRPLYFKELSINTLESTIKRRFIDLPEKKQIFSIDPEETNDIDDALSFEEYDSHYIVGVYIAQPIYYLTQELIEIHSKKAFSTLYNNGYSKNNNLWGDKITLASSLIPNEERPAYAIFYYIDKKYNFIKIENYPVIIINKIKTNYDNCLNYDFIQNLYNLTNNLYNINNTHELVSYWMVKTNNHIGLNYKLPNRVIKKNIENNLENFDVNDDIKNIFINSSAYYSLSENYHEILDKYNYIHFTSPIRRIIDTLNHWSITYNIPFTDFNINIDDINKLDKQTKKYHNNIKLLEAIDKLSNETIFDGWIYKNNWKKSLNKISVYFKELGFLKVELLNNKFNYLINYFIENKFNEIKVGNKYKFKILKKEGFLPKDKLVIKFMIIDEFLQSFLI